MLMNDYQKKAMRTARSADAKDEIFHLLLGLSGEVGEVMEKAKKVVRDNDSHFDDNFRRELYKELGDVLISQHCAIILILTWPVLLR